MVRVGLAGVGCLAVCCAGCAESVNQAGVMARSVELAVVPKQLSSKRETFEFAEVSPDGLSLAFVSDRAGALKVWGMAVGGGALM